MDIGNLSPEEVDKYINVESLYKKDLEKYYSPENKVETYCSIIYIVLMESVMDAAIIKQANHYTDNKIFKFFKKNKYFLQYSFITRCTMVVIKFFFSIIIKYFRLILSEHNNIILENEIIEFKRKIDNSFTIKK